MKKLLQKLSAFVIVVSLTTATSYAQLSDCSIAPDFTATDINGTTWHLYDLLDQGKTVFIDISATWCYPCWIYHTSGKLESLYNLYGPSGTNECMVFMIEGDGTTNTNCLYGTNGCNSTTQGDWVTGTPYPIIDDANIANSYQITYFPTIYMISPDRTVRLNGQITTAQHYSAMTTYSFTAVGADDGGIMCSSPLNVGLVSCSSVDIKVRLCNYGTSPLTSAALTLNVNGFQQQVVNWTGNLATYKSAVVTFPAVTGNPGNNTAEVSVSLPNGNTDANTLNDFGSYNFKILNVANAVPAFSQDFVSGTFPPADYNILNADNGNTWKRKNPGNGSAGSMGIDFYNYGTSGAIDEIILPVINLTGANAANLSFDVAYAYYSYNGSNSYDNLKVRVSTNCGVSWSLPYNKTGTALATAGGMSTEFTAPSSSQWRTDNVSLNNFVGNPSLLVKFVGVCGIGNDLYIDNINVSSTTGIDDVGGPVLFKTYPNPATSEVNVQFMTASNEDVTINVYNSLGQSVYSTKASSSGMTPKEVKLNVDNLSKGLYSVSLVTSGKSVSKIISVQ